MWNPFKRSAPAPAPEPEPKTGVVEATGVAMASRRTLGRAMESAMAAEVMKISAESEALWAGPGSETEKNKAIAALNDPANVRRRMLEAKEAVKRAAHG